MNSLCEVLNPSILYNTLKKEGEKKGLQGLCCTQPTSSSHARLQHDSIRPFFNHLQFVISLRTVSPSPNQKLSLLDFLF